MRHLTLASFALLALTACRSAEGPSSARTPGPQQTAASFQLFPDLGSYHRTMSTRSPEAQRWFDQGMTFAYSFDHTSAIRSFQEAAKLDPSAAMPWWGIALANGPHINNPTVDPDRARAAWDAIGKARARAGGSTPIERALIEAQARRYAEGPVENRRPLDEAYAAAMREIWQAHPDDVDAGTLFAESLMDLQPWDLWTHDGAPKGSTEEIVATLEAVLARAPEHPGANHLYIHAVEASPHPDKALAAADRLRTLVPGASHMVHMPSHIDVRVGRWADAALANERAIEVDRRYANRSPRAGFYQIYRLHNVHFLTYASMMEGRSKEALDSARRMVANVPPELLESLAEFVDGFEPVVLHVLVRFGRWEDVLREPEFPAALTASNAMRRYARAVSLAALDRLDEAEKEEQALASAIEAVDEKRPIGNNPARRVLEVAKRMVRGEIAFRRGNAEEAFAVLREGAALQDGLQYDEPPDWMMPVRHALGAALLEADRAADAEKVYREDLVQYPENGWALFGLARALERQGRADEARATQARFEKAWARADVALKSSCFCQPGD